MSRGSESKRNEREWRNWNENLEKRKGIIVRTKKKNRKTLKRSQSYRRDGKQPGKKLKHDDEGETEREGEK